MNGRQFNISAVHINGFPAVFTRQDRIEQPIDPNRVLSGPGSYSLFRESLAASVLESNLGEIAIEIPESVDFRPKDDMVLDNQPIEITDGNNAETPKYQLLVVRIDFSLSDPEGGAYFVLPNVLHKEVCLPEFV